MAGGGSTRNVLEGQPSAKAHSPSWGFGLLWSAWLYHKIFKGLRKRKGDAGRLVMLKVITGRAFTSDGINPWPRFSDQRPSPQIGIRSLSSELPTSLSKHCRICWGHGSTFHSFISAFLFPSQCGQDQLSGP